MNPMTLLLIFAWIAIIALCCSLLSDFWLPMLIGAVLITHTDQDRRPADRMMTRHPRYRPQSPRVPHRRNPS